MRHVASTRSPWLWGLMLLGLVSMGGASAVPSSRMPQQPIPYAAGLLFELKSPADGPPSYLFGTIHSEDPRVLALPEPVAAALDEAPALVLEVVPDAAALQAAAQAMRLAPGTTLGDVLPPALYQESVAVLSARGMPEAALQDLEPWAVMVLILSPEAKTGIFLDRYLFQRAQAAGKSILGLETTAEQLSLFEQLSDAEQQALLRAALAAQGARAQLFSELISAYLDGDLGGLLALSAQHTPGLDPELERRFRNMLVASRNKRMAHRISALPAGQQHFIAVGALHLPGAEGVLSHLARRGYGIKRLY